MVKRPLCLGRHDHDPHVNHVHQRVPTSDVWLFPSLRAQLASDRTCQRGCLHFSLQSRGKLLTETSPCLGSFSILRHTHVARCLSDASFCAIHPEWYVEKAPGDWIDPKGLRLWVLVTRALPHVFWIIADRGPAYFPMM